MYVESQEALLRWEQFWRLPDRRGGTLQVWRVAASVARPLLRIDVVLEILVENLIRCHQWSLTTLTTF